MVQEPVWKVGPTMLNIYDTLRHSLRLLKKNSDHYLSDAFLLRANIRMQQFDLSDKDEFFGCMTEQTFSRLQPSDPPQPYVPYEDVEPPDSDPPSNVFELEDCAFAVELWFHDLQCRKVAEDGHGCIWPEEPGFWVPRQIFKYEDLYNGSRMTPSVPWQLFRAMYNAENAPHLLYHAWHGDEGREQVISRSEVEIFIRTMKRRMEDAAYSTHIVPILLLSVHGSKARIMIAHFDQNTMILNIKCSKFEQFDGFEGRKGAGHTKDRIRPRDFEAKRDLFFRWLNPTCHGRTLLEDSKDAPEMVMRGPKGRQRLVPRSLSPVSISTESSQSNG